MPLPVAEFVRRWKINSLSERAGAQSHFLDLCDMLGEPHPAASDPTGERYTFEKPVQKTSEGKGFADVWLRDHFAWEYKGKHKDLRAAYKQLNDYREDLLNPPLLVVCDLNRFEVHTNFGNTAKRVYSFTLDDLGKNQVTASCPLPPLTVLRALFGDTSKLRPEYTDAFVTQEAAKLFSRLAERLELEERNLGATRAEIAHFLMRLLFCLFADSVGLLPDRVFRRLVEIDRFYPRRFLLKLPHLFRAMSFQDGIFGEHTIRWFNGGLFEDEKVLQLDKADMGILYEVAHKYDWSHIAPAIFGTLFERSLDPKRRSLIGAHYTSEEDILLLIEPVVMRPLEQRWADTQASILTLQPSARTLLRSNPEAEALLAGFFDHLASIRILDPACGSGNFLYVALRRLLDLWKRARDFAIEHGIQLGIKYASEKMVSPSQLFGIEIEFYAHELASIVVWIGFLQWKYENGIQEDREPILLKLSNIEHNDAILRYDAEGKAYEPEWPKADFIVGNPPFLGSSQMKSRIGDIYCDHLRNLYSGRVKGAADLVVYWFEKARNCIEQSPTTRVGLLATQGIRGGANQFTLQRIVESGTIFWAISDRNWLLDGATVHVSMIAFTRLKADASSTLDGEVVVQIFPDLTSSLDTTKALSLSENFGLCFRGTEMHGDFDLPEEVAAKMLRAPVNPNGRANADVLRRYINATDVTNVNNHRYVIDFGTTMSADEAALYELPFEYITKHVFPIRSTNRREIRRRRWWLHGEPNPSLRNAIKNLDRYIATPRVSKHRIFAWVLAQCLPDSALCLFARSDDYFFGILHSLIHELWARKTGTQLRDVTSGFRYTPQSTFDTFPFPYPPGTEPPEADSPVVRAIAEAARTLVQLRDSWLNPPNASAEDLKERTLTKLYNKRPAWLENAHGALDEAVFAAYGWPYPLAKQEILARLLALNHERAAASAPATKALRKSRPTAGAAERHA